MAKLLDDGTIQGKTQLILPWLRAPYIVECFQLDVLTANNDPRATVECPGKGALVNRTNAAIMEFCRAQVTFPIAFTLRYSDTSFTAKQCTPFPLEIVCRLNAAGSILKRVPSLIALQMLEEPVIERNLKTDEAEWNGTALPCVDPLIVGINYEAGTMQVVDAGVGFGNWDVLTLRIPNFFPTEEEFREIEQATIDLTNVLAKGLGIFSLRLLDIKLEWGLLQYGTWSRIVYLIDIICGDNMRVLAPGNLDGLPVWFHLDKQLFRAGCSPDLVLMAYELLADVASMLAESGSKRKVGIVPERAQPILDRIIEELGPEKAHKTVIYPATI